MLDVTVVTATRNRTDLLERALRSVAAQTGVALQAVVVDDGSANDVLVHHDQLIERLGSRFSMLRPAMPGAPGTGPAAARNRGIRAAEGEFVAFIDDDDEWIATDHLEVAVKALRGRQADYFFAHLVGQRDGVERNPGWVPPPDALSGEPRIGSGPEVVELSPRAVRTVARRFMIHPSSSVVRREVLEGVGGFFEALWSHGEDLNLMLRLLDAARGVLYTPRLATHYRLPAGNSISLSEDEMRHFLQRIVATQHARLTCRRPEMRACARAKEAWTYREMAGHAWRHGHGADARAFARQVLVTYPTLGAAAFLMRLMATTLRRRAIQRPSADGSGISL